LAKVNRIRAAAYWKPLLAGDNDFTQPVSAAPHWHPLKPRSSTMKRIDPLLAEVEEMFGRIDADGDRIIGFEEFSAFMRKMDHTRTEPSLRVNFDAIDTNRDGTVSFDEFRAWCGGWR
jgi:hypothetical protein